ncbi:MAG TPA: serine/threonine protein kinase [Deltaproteobacteria bacterium]|nr:serine/threonine protein kinase [Deltaproteobacteria bacterium]
MQLEPGTVLAQRFEVTGPPLGAGASGVVYPAEDRATGRSVAAKVLHPDRAADRAALSRLQDEASTVGRLQHPHVAEVVGLWSDGGSRWVLVTERIDGIPLSALDAALQPEAVVALGLQLVEALMASHGVGILHGDVRPGNVLIGTAGAKLFDFGVARWVAQGDEGAMIRAGETAPEVIDGAPPSVASDLYGLGIVLCRALTGATPFAAATPWASMGLQRAGSLELEGPRGLVALIERLLEPNPAARPPDASAVRLALVRLRSDPGRRLSFGGWRAPPLRPGRAWIVHGIDPQTGGPAVIRGGLSRRAARKLVARLSSEGWRVQADREALGSRDVLWVALLTAVGGLAVPLVGVLPALWVSVRWRGHRVRPELRRVLPPISVPIPPRVAPTGNETAVVAGMLLLLTALTLVVWPLGALLPALLVGLLAAWSLRAAPIDPADAARRGHVVAALADLRATVASRALTLDEVLSLTGEVDALEAAWRSGEIEADTLLIEVDRLSHRVEGLPLDQALDHASVLALRPLGDRAVGLRGVGEPARVVGLAQGVPEP